MASNKWIQGDTQKSSLHRALGVPAGKKISGKMLAKAMKPGSEKPVKTFNKKK